MELTPSGLRTHEYASPGWQTTYNNNFEILNDALGEIIANEDDVVDSTITTAGTDVAGATYTSAEQDIINNLVQDIVIVNEKVNEILAKLRSLLILKATI